ncbi:MAG: hypothetical protein WD022_00490 [Balneolaceae bacterium]
MLFGLPWPAIVALVAIVGGLFYAYKEQELKMEERRMGSSRELNELRQIVHNLKSRIENLEAIAAEEKKRPSAKDVNPLGDIEFDDEVDGQNADNISSRTKNRN